MKIKLFDLELSFDAPITVYDADRSAEKIDRSVIAAKVNGNVVALNYLLENDAEVELTLSRTPTASTFSITQQAIFSRRL